MERDDVMSDVTACVKIQGPWREVRGGTEAHSMYYSYCSTVLQVPDFTGQNVSFLCLLV